MTNDRGVGLLAMTSPMSAILSADVTSPKLSHLAVWQEGVSLYVSCQSIEGMQF